MSDTQKIEIIGTSALKGRLTMEGFEVADPIRDRGIDLIVYADEPSRPFKAIPIQIKCSSRTSFGVYKKYEKFEGLVFVYIWEVMTTPRFFIVPYADACALIPDQQKTTASWNRERNKGAYSWRAVPKSIANGLLEYENNWDILRNILNLR